MLKQQRGGLIIGISRPVYEPSGFFGTGVLRPSFPLRLGPVCRRLNAQKWHGDFHENYGVCKLLKDCLTTLDIPL